MPLEDTSFVITAPGHETLLVPFMHGETSVEPILLRARSE